MPMSHAILSLNASLSAVDSSSPSMPTTVGGASSVPDFEAQMATARGLLGERMALTADLHTLSDTTRATCPDAVIAWAEAQIGLLERFIAAHHGAEHSTSRSVANGEIAEWKRV
jgi:hypothetical protein